MTDHAGSKQTKPTASEVLTLMDGMETYEDVCVLASTNRAELLDEAPFREFTEDQVELHLLIPVEGIRN